ncbi:hypothetical protein HD554DRAFT_2041433 [Boletus coccyginus]|nr:hypothetical protein HD554DRAFT_2041433 [Boletus coccyginus]
MEHATGVSAQQLMALHPGLSSIQEKLHLASTQQTTLVEDAAYSLLGIFLVTSIPAIYGEGEDSLGHLLVNVLTVSGDTGDITPAVTHSRCRDTTAFGMVEIGMRHDLFQIDSLYLVHSWLDVLLKCEDKSGRIVGEDILPLPSPDTDDEEILDEDIEHLPEPESPSHSTPAPSTGGRLVDYKRVTADSVITVQLKENFSLADVLDNLRMLEVL